MTRAEPAQRIALLVVEDEYLIAVALEDALKDAGFSVVLTSGGIEAIEHLDENARELVALVTDIRLGAGPSGWEVAHHARRINGEIRVVTRLGTAPTSGRRRAFH